MKNAITSIQVTTPCISSGADQKVAEIRSQSLRGGLHYWFRALGGSLEQEQRIFGRIGKEDEIRRSTLTVRTVLSGKIRTSEKNCMDMTGSKFDYFLWPMRDQKDTPGSGNRGVVEAGEQFELRLSHVRIRGGSRLPEKALKAFLLLGAVGTRSRRCYGGLWPQKVVIDGTPWQVPESMDAFSTTLSEVLTNSRVSVATWGAYSKLSEALQGAKEILKRYRCGSTKSGDPSKWGKNDHDVPFGKRGTVYRPVLGLPLQQRYTESRETWKSKIQGNDRWASPLRLKIVPLDRVFHVLAIYMEDELPEEGIEIKLEGKGRSIDATLSHELWQELKKEGTMIYSGLTNNRETASGSGTAN